MHCSAILCAFVLPAASSLGIEPVFGQHKYTEYRAGSLPIIIGVPHGGNQRPNAVADRRFGRTAQDSFTQEIALLIAQECQRVFQAQPHLIFCHLHRMKVDCNREIREGAQGDPLAEKTWAEFHAFVDLAVEHVQTHAGKGLYIDLHGHRHTEMLVELGYLLSPKDLRALNPSMAERCSIKELTMERNTDFSELIRGKSSLGGLLEAHGFGSIPSPSHPAPAITQEYFYGGYNTSRYNSILKGEVSGIQIECPLLGVRDKPEHHTAFAKALLDSLRDWWKTHCHTELQPYSVLEAEAKPLR
jgi:N-formylglutamate amidohydrolase